jgi:hypothetical protein
MDRVWKIVKSQWSNLTTPFFSGSSDLIYINYVTSKWHVLCVHLSEFLSIHYIPSLCFSAVTKLINVTQRWNNYQDTKEAYYL